MFFSVHAKQAAYFRSFIVYPAKRQFSISSQKRAGYIHFSRDYFFRRIGFHDFSRRARQVMNGIGIPYFHKGYAHILCHPEYRLVIGFGKRSQATAAPATLTDKIAHAMPLCHDSQPIK
jgi:hypothetical protein